MANLETRNELFNGEKVRYSFRATLGRGLR